MLPAKLVPFLTAFDPAEKGGGSIDPLGFERAYLQLADAILPGLTNVASRPRYFGLLCAAANLARPDSDRPREQATARLQAVLRLERLWALANVLASEETGDYDSGAIRGVSYAKSHLRYLEGKKATRATTDFRLLSNQSRYGAIGIYGNVAEGLGLWDRRTLLPTPEFGEELGRAFLEETEAPAAVRRAAQGEDEEIPLDTLRRWGRRALVDNRLTRPERQVVATAVEHDGVRRRMVEALARRPPQKDETELDRLARIAENLADRDSDLGEAIGIIVAYEKSYMAAQLVLERILWACGQAPVVSITDFNGDTHVGKAQAGLRAGASSLRHAVDRVRHDRVRKALEALPQVRAFVDEAAGASSAAALVERIAARHADVQRGKFDRGRPKMAWFELTKGSVRLTFARSTERRREPRILSDVEPHPYRTAAADQVYAAEAVA